MRRVTESHGFTVVETMIFLAVSAAMFVSAMLVVSGQQARTEFRQGVGEIQSRIDDTINDVATGYYASSLDRQCTAASTSTSPPSITNNTAERGTSRQCIVLGRAVMLLPGRSSTFTVLGRRLVGGPGTAYTQSLTEAVAAVPQNPELVSQSAFPYGLRVHSAYFQEQPGGAKQSIQGFALTSSLASYASGGALQSGASSVDLIPIPGPNSGFTEDGFATEASVYLKQPTAVVNPAGGVTVCIDQGPGSENHILLRLTPGVTLSTTVDYRSGPAASNTGECSI
jgi:hypothetical protein